MFNEILTGKASLERQAVPGAPYREPSVPEEKRACVSCGQPFPTLVTSAARTCSRCNFAAESRLQAQILELSESSRAANRRALRKTRWLWSLLVLPLLVAFKVGIQRQYDEDMRTAGGEHASDARTPPKEDTSFQWALKSYRDEMCHCKDTVCTAATRAQVAELFRGAQLSPVEQAWAPEVQSDIDSCAQAIESPVHY